MKTVDLIASFELEINKLDDSVNKPVTDDSLYWINQAIVKFIKDRFNGNAPKRTSYEQNEKRTRDLVKLVTTEELALRENGDSGWRIPHNDYEEWGYKYPENLMFMLTENVVIADKDGENVKDVPVFECTADNFMYRINNSLTDFHYRHHYARPLRIRTSDGCLLLTERKSGEGTYCIQSYTITYLRKPIEVIADKDQECSDFEDYTWLEIIKIAAQMYIENQSDPRYRSITNEVLTQE